MRVLISVLVLALVASAKLSRADDYGQQLPVVISFYGQPMLVASYPSGAYYNWPAVPAYPVVVSGANAPVRIPDYNLNLAGYWPTSYRPQEIYYSAPPTPPGMLDAPLGANTAGKQSTMPTMLR